MLTTVRIYLVGFVGAILLRLINSTLRWHRVGLDGELRSWASGKPIILLFWHDTQLLMPWIYLNSRSQSGNKPISVLISEHSDGRMVAKAMEFLGIGSIAGSSTRGGREALFKLIGKVNDGEHVAITPDGPKGPRHKLKSGVIRIAQRTGAPIYPSTIFAQNRWTFGSWDKMTLPKPFSKAVVMMGEPIYVPSELNNEELLQWADKVENALNAITARAENFKFDESA